ncbi:MAG TPA: RES domain-containing protein [Afifellaceae bacterium]|nr:RES domain-containing protein [Afifellaceae bacterium]
MRLADTFYRGHDPKWDWSPLSGEGAAIHGGRFNPKGMPALYLASDVIGAVNEMSHGFTARILPLTMCSYDVDCEQVADLTDETVRARHGTSLEEMAAGWFPAASSGNPPGWILAHRLVDDGYVGALVPSFALNAEPRHRNLVLWDWGPDLPSRVAVYDPSGRLPKNALSWA